MTTPRIFLSHQTAFAYWVHRDVWETRKTRSVPTASDKQSVVALKDTRHLIIALNDKQPIHASVCSSSNIFESEGIVLHYRSVPYPDWSFRRINKDTFVASPELCFLQAASILPFNALVLYGMELCGTYARTKEIGGTRYKREPLTSARKIAAYLGKSQGATGIKQALKASAYLMDGSASPREAVLESIMTLPPRLQGFSMPKPQLNYGIPVDLPDPQDPSKQLVLHGDIVWPEARLVVEYDGEQHGQQDNHASDKQRDHLLLDAGFEVVRFTDQSIRSGAELERLAHTINRKAHLRKPASQLQWDSSKEALLDELLNRSDLPWL